MSLIKSVHSETFQAVLNQAALGKGLLPSDTAVLIDCQDDEVWRQIFQLASTLTERHFKRKICFFAPLYYSDYCVNDCVYCSFRSGNPWMSRKILSEDEMLKEARFLWEAGHRTLLFVAGEHRRVAGLDKLAGYAALLKKAGLHFDLAFEGGPLEEVEYRELNQQGFKRVVLYQETYHREIYAEMHPHGPKKLFERRYEAPARALRGGISSFGLGVLLGLDPNWKNELIELHRHAKSLKDQFGNFFLTFSFPRLRPADGFVPARPEALVCDDDFEKIMALTRVAFPTAGLVVSTRETAAFRRRLLEKGVGVTHMSAGVSTSTGGYAQKKAVETGQFDICDERSLCEVTSEIAALGLEAEGVFSVRT